MSEHEPSKLVVMKAVKAYETARAEGDSSMDAMREALAAAALASPECEHCGE